MINSSRLLRKVLLSVWLGLFSMMSCGMLTPLPVRAQASGQDYRLGAGDVVTVTVARHPEMSAEEAVINSAGRIALPVLGSVYVAGKTVAQVKQELTKRFVVALRRPEVTVTLKQARVRTISILGAVEKPGVYDLKPGWRISDALAAAGGLTSRPEITEGALGRAKQKTLYLDLTGIIRDPGDAANQTLMAGDTLRFSPRTAQVSIAGQVKQPGAFTVPQGSSVLEVLALAGGANPTAALSQATIRHRNDNTTRPLDLLALMNGGPDDALRVEDGDLIVIPESKSRISVLGAVANPGTFNLPEKSTLRVADALALAGGLNVPPGTARIMVSRQQEGAEARNWTIDAAALLERNDATLNELIQDGDLISAVAVSRKIFINGEVKTPGAYDLKEGDSVAKLIALAGGTTETAALTRVAVQRGGETIPVNVQAALKEGAALDFPLQDGDFVVVPRNNARVLVLGAVNKPGAVPIEEERQLRLGEAIGLAGGARDRARVKEIGIFRNTQQGVQRQVVSLDKMYNGQPGLNVVLQNGDTLYVPEGKTTVSFWEQIGRVLPFLTIF
jgi:protein involved in polysaccharide export with SLBB domain